jgi:hypothetical protein
MLNGNEELGDGDENCWQGCGSRNTHGRERSVFEYDIDCLLGVGIGIVVNHFVKSLLPVPLPLPITNFTN